MKNRAPITLYEYTSTTTRRRDTHAPSEPGKKMEYARTFLEEKADRYDLLLRECEAQRTTLTQQPLEDIPSVSQEPQPSDVFEDKAIICVRRLIRNSSLTPQHRLHLLRSVEYRAKEKILDATVFQRALVALVRHLRMFQLSVCGIPEAEEYSEHAIGLIMKVVDDAGIEKHTWLWRNIRQPFPQWPDRQAYLNDKEEPTGE